ncbi:hypothetical protein ACHAXN_002209 [Cyclotella atomus]
MDPSILSPVTIHRPSTAAAHLPSAHPSCLLANASLALSPCLLMILLTPLIFQTASTHAFEFFVHPSRTNSATRCRSSIEDKSNDTPVDPRRRHLLEIAAASSIITNSASSNAATKQISNPSPLLPIDGIHDVRLRNYYNPSLPSWHGSSLKLLSLESAAKVLSDQHVSDPTLPMGRWPDPALRRAASPIPPSVFQSTNHEHLVQLQSVASALKNTARNEGAVGLAAQQCGVDVSLIFIDGVREKHPLVNVNAGKTIHAEGTSDSRNNNQDGIFLVNPRIIQRSPESEMLVWTEECLVLPPEFRATLLRDASVTIEYETLLGTDDDGITKQITLSGELARCAQHEMDHDRGVLIVDHVSLAELLSINDDDFMARIENADGLHEMRIRRAYERYVSDSVLLSPTVKDLPLAFESYHDIQSRITEVEYKFVHEEAALSWFARPVYAIDDLQPSVPKDANKTNEYQSNSIKKSEQTECDASCLEERRAKIEMRRAMMQQSRSSTNRGDVLKLSEQRAALYGTSYGGLPSKACSNPGFCP